MRRAIALLVVVFLVLGAASGSSAFDGQRKGFILGFGLGPGITSFDHTVEDAYLSMTSEGESPFGIHTDFRIGAGINEQFQIYWSSRVSFFKLDSLDFSLDIMDTTLTATFGFDAMVATGVAGVGCSYFFKPTAPSPYLTGTLGFCAWSLPFEDGADTWIGFGFAAGLGYEFAPHWSVEGVLSYGNASGDRYWTDAGIYTREDYSTSPLAVKVTVNALAY